jgi:hypothetical protein
MSAIMLGNELKHLREEYYEARRELAEQVGDLFPRGSRCAIVRTRKGKEYHIYGIVWHVPSEFDPTRIGVKTESRGTILNADYQDIVLL